MFKSRGLVLDSDFLDVSFARPEQWAPLPWKSLRGTGFLMGDATSGPEVDVVAFQAHADEVLDWTHTIDPMHYHGTDQYRLQVDGTWVTARTPLEPGGFCFQEAGRVYQEHPGESGRSWMILIYADRRGQPATLTLESDRAAILGAGVTDIAGAKLARDYYPHPAGPKGTPAIASSDSAPVSYTHLTLPTILRV